jgi:hypothetical protein
MGFLNNLAKGFVRSAVNQVGRDSGKVVSNQIYGNSDSTPLSVNSNQSTIEKEGLVEEKEYVWVKIIWAIVISTILPIIGGLIIIYRGYVNYNKKFVKMFRIESQAVYAQDRRYDTGQRYEGHKQVKIPVQIEADEIQLKRAKIKSCCYFIVGISFIILYSLYLK